MDNQIYQTTDTLEAAYLVSAGFNYNQMVEVDQERVAFVFDFSDELHKEVIKFKSGKALIEPTKFLYNYKKLLVEIKHLKSKHQWQRLKSFRLPRTN